MIVHKKADINESKPSNDEHYMITSFPNRVSFYIYDGSAIPLFENFVVELGLVQAQHIDKYEWEVAKKYQKRKDRRYLRNDFTRGCEKGMVLAKEHAYRCWDVTCKSYRNDFCIHILFIELLFGIKQFFASNHQHNKICQRLYKQDYQKLDDKHLA